MGEMIDQQSQLPAYLQNKQDEEALKEVRGSVRPPFLKIIQGQAEAPYDKYDPGDLLAIPQNIVIAKKDTEGVHFVCLDHFKTWMQINPIEMKGKEDFVREFTTDSNHPVAQKSKNASTWFEPHPENPDLQIRNCEVLNYMVYVEGFELELPMLWGFFKGEYGTGQNLAALLQGAMTRGAPMYGCRWRAVPAKHTGKLGNWWGLDILTPVEPWVSEQALPRMEEMALQIRELRKTNQLDTQFEGEVDPETESETQFG